MSMMDCFNMLIRFLQKKSYPIAWNVKKRKGGSEEPPKVALA